MADTNENTSTTEKLPRPQALAVVTGASSGIGYELAKKFAREGYDLLIVAEDEGIEAAAKELAQIGTRVESAKIDLAQFDGVERFYEQITGFGRPVDILAINAGVGVGGEFAGGTDLKAELNMIALNCVSAVHLAKRVIPDMVQVGAGRILFTSSIAALMPAPFEAVYGATKAFLLSFSEAIRNELKDTGVSVTAVLPGPTDTNFFHRAGMDDTKVGVADKDDPAQVADQAFEALMADRDQTLAGSVATRLQGLAAKILPETTTAELHRKMSEPGSADASH